MSDSHQVGKTTTVEHQHQHQNQHLTWPCEKPKPEIAKEWAYQKKYALHSTIPNFYFLPKQNNSY